ncbi:MAG: hypothetical protein EOO59_12555 [Hymenobacter sp.]|nr:MAG: hypothetical protein EOO59_12555 [Hymenobacter sp.]
MDDYAWLFTNNPYALHSQYGSGHWTTFIEHFPTLLGWPLTLLFVLGGLAALGRAVALSAWKQRLFRAEIILIYGAIVVHTVAHTLLWAYGLFGSFGLTRVMAVLTPLCAIAALSGLAWLLRFAKTVAARRWLLAATTTIVVLMVFSRDHTFKLSPDGVPIGHEGNLHWRRDFREQTDLILADAATNWLRQHDPSWRWHPIAFDPRFRELWRGTIKANPDDPDSWKFGAVIFEKTRQ